MAQDPQAPRANIEIKGEEPWVVLEVSGKPVQFLIDEGATYSVLTSYVGPLS